MSYRYQKRIKLFGGFGLNLSKSGMSWSVRGVGGSIGSKGYSIKTGIKGLTYRSAFKKSDNNYQKKNSSIITVIILVVLFGIIFYIFSPWIFLVYFIIASIAILIFMSRGIVNKDDNEQNTYDPTINANNNSESEPIPSSEISFKIPDISVNRINLDTEVIIYIDNLCGEIFDLITIANKEPDILEQANNSFENLRTFVICDLSRIFYYLDISIYNSKVERDIFLVASGHFFEPEISVDILNNDIDCYERFVRIIDKYINSPHPLGLDISVTPFVLTELFKKNDSLLYEYKNKLRDFTALITTIDNKLSKKESKILEMIGKL